MFSFETRDPYESIASLKGAKLLDLFAAVVKTRKWSNVTPQETEFLISLSALNINMTSWPREVDGGWVSVYSSYHLHAFHFSHKKKYSSWVEARKLCLWVMFLEKISIQISIHFIYLYSNFGVADILHQMQRDQNGGVGLGVAICQGGAFCYINIV